MAEDSPLVVDTYDGQVHVEWNPQAAVTPLGQLPFFIEFLKLSMGTLIRPLLWSNLASQKRFHFV